MAFTYNELYTGQYAENHQIQIVSDRWVVKGFLTDETSFDGRAFFREENDPSYQEAFNDILRRASGWINSASALAGQTNRAAVPAMQVKQAASTMVNWQSTDLFRLNLDLIFVATSLDDDVRIPVRCLSEAVFPTFGSTGGVAETFYSSIREGESLPEATNAAIGNAKEKNTFVTFIMAPMGYQRGNYEKPVGVMRVLLGKWFKSSSIFVCEDSTFRFSKEVMPNGRPLYATGNVMLTTCRPISSTEMKAWLSPNASVTKKFVGFGKGYEYPEWGDVINAQARAALPDMSDGNNPRYYETPQPMKGTQY